MVKKLITLDGLTVFLSELRKEINAGAGKCFDAEELTRRIPSWQWKVTMPKTTRQTVTATVGGKTYTRDFYAQQGSRITFSVTPDAGYIAGSLSTTCAILNKDLTVTITAATESEEIEAGTKTFDDDDYFTVPLGAHVLKWTWAGKDTYTKVIPGDGLAIRTSYYYDSANKRHYYAELSYNGSRKDSVFFTTSDAPLTVAWSKEINKHAYDYDWSN